MLGTSYTLGFTGGPGIIISLVGVIAKFLTELKKKKNSSIRISSKIINCFRFQ